MNPTILVVDDSPSVRQMVVTHLELADYAVLQAGDGQTALEVMQTQPTAVVLLDWMMPGMEGPEVARRIRHELQNEVSYIIMLTARDSAHDQVAGLRTGIDLYVTKPFDTEVLLAQVEKGVETFKKRCLAEEHSHFAWTDSLTGLSNRRAFDDRLAQEIQRARRHRHALSLVMVDLDHFKEVNDRFGHPVGDQVLRELAQVLRASSRGSDLPFRYGGEEFAILLPETDLPGGVVHGETIRAAIACHEFPHVGHKTASLGVAQWREEDTAAALLDRADVALYRAKHSGRNRVEG